MAGIISAGVGSGLDITSLVNQLVNAEGAVKAKNLDKQEMASQVGLSALSNLKGALSGFQASLSELQKFNQFDSRIANNDLNNLFTVAVTTDAPVNQYEVEVKNLASAQKLMTAGFPELQANIGTGTLTFQFGTYDGTGNTFTLNPNTQTSSVLIDEDHQTLQGIVDAVNKAGIRVTASTLYDGTEYRLVFSTGESGAANSMKITGISQLAYDPTLPVGSGQNLTQSVAALDATLVVDGLAVKSPTNTVKNVIPGITMNLLTAQPGTTSTVNVQLNSGVISGAVEKFVKSYNTLLGTFHDLASYDPKTKKAGVMFGDPTLRMIEIQMRRMMGNNIPGVSGSYQALSSIGVKSQSNGTLTLDNEVLAKVIAQDPNAVAPLFAAGAMVTDPLVKVNGIGADTQSGSYKVNISQLATQGTLVGSASANTTITSGVNDTMVVALDGGTATITLDPGTYAASDLALEIQTRINGVSGFSSAGSQVTVTQNAGILTLTSERYGAASSIAIVGGNNDALGLTPTATAGVDVAGKIGGVTASGTGTVLSGVGVLDGLEIDVTGGTTGDRGMVTVTRGVANQLDALLTSVLEAKGSLDTRDGILKSRIDDINNQRLRLNDRLESYKARLVQQFTALDEMMSSLRSTSDFLTQQFAHLPGNSKN